MIFDEVDRALLGQLQDYALASIDELAAAAGCEPDAAQQRIQALIDGGVIVGYHTEIDLGAIGRGVQGLITVRMRSSASEAVDAFREWILTTPEAVALYATSGSSDFFVHVALPTVESLHSFVSAELSRQPGVVDARTNIVFEHTRSHAVAPIAAACPERHRRPLGALDTYAV